MLPVLFALALPIPVLLVIRSSNDIKSKWLYWVGATIAVAAFSIIGEVSLGLDCFGDWLLFACVVSNFSESFMAVHVNPSELDHVMLLFLFGSVAFLFYSILVLGMSRRHEAGRRLRLVRVIASAGVCLGLSILFWVTLPGQAVYSIDPPIPAAFYRLRLEYNVQSETFTGVQEVEFLKGDQDTLYEEVWERLLARRFGDWKPKFSNEPEGPLVRDGISSHVDQRTLLTSTLFFSLPYIRAEDTEISVLAPEHVILRHNLDSDARPTILDDGSDGVSIVGRVSGYNVRLKTAASLLQNPLLGSLATLSTAKIVLVVLAAMSGLIAYLFSIFLGVFEDETLKPLATSILKRLGILKSTPNNDG